MGVTFDIAEKKFVFDFEHDGVEDIVSLTGDGYQVEAFGKCFYYGYEFSGQIESSVRTAFIKYVKFTEALQDTPDLTNFIKKAVDNLHKKINLYNFDLVVMPESSSKVNQYMLRYIYRFAQPTLYKMTLVKALPSNISFDMKAYEKQIRFESEEEREFCSKILQQNVLVIDDVTTSGSTLNEVLRTLRILNEDNEITIFSLIGRKDLMADSY
jgi:predicted amidophosphoribosyltransferase